jgi:hypothetical protein
MGWPTTTRTIAFLANEINIHIDRINSYNEKGIWPRRYFIEERVPLERVDQKTLNQIHHHFESLIGQVWAMSPFFISSDAPTRYSILQINNLVHELEALAGTFASVNRDEDPFPFILASFLPHKLPPTSLLEEDYELFQTNISFGSVALKYCQLGKSHWSAWLDQDAEIGPENVNGLRFYEPDFVLHFGESSGSREEFYSWLRSHGVPADEKSPYFTDLNGQKQGLGELIVGKMPRAQFNGKSDREIIDWIGDHPNIAAISAFENGELIAKREFPYTWKSPGYEKMFSFANRGNALSKTQY